MKMICIDGVNLHYKFINSNLHTTFVFINSLGTDFRIWDEVVNELKGYGSILLSDKRGHGLSDTVAQTNDINDYASDIMGLIKQLGLKKIILVGLSVGGMIAQIIANAIPATIEKLILCDTRFKIGNEKIWNQRIEAVHQNGLKGISDGVMERWFSEAFRKAYPEKISGYKNMLEQTTVQGYIKTCECIRDANLTEEAKKINVPTICIVGSEDKSTTPDEVKNLSDLITGSLYKIIEGSGHIPCVDNPLILANLIIDFIK